MPNFVDIKSLESSSLIRRVNKLYHHRGDLHTIGIQEHIEHRKELLEILEELEARIHTMEDNIRNREPSPIWWK